MAEIGTEGVFSPICEFEFRFARGSLWVEAQRQARQCKAGISNLRRYPDGEIRQQALDELVAWLHNQPTGKIVTEYFPVIYSRYLRRQEGVPFMLSVTGWEFKLSG